MLGVTTCSGTLGRVEALRVRVVVAILIEFL